MSSGVWFGGERSVVRMTAKGRIVITYCILRTFLSVNRRFALPGTINTCGSWVCNSSSRKMKATTRTPWLHTQGSKSFNVASWPRPLAGKQNLDKKTPDNERVFNASIKWLVQILYKHTRTWYTGKSPPIFNAAIRRRPFGGLGFHFHLTLYVKNEVKCRSRILRPP